MLHGADWLSYFPGAPEFVNREFTALLSAGLPAMSPLIVKGSEPSEASRAEDAAGTDGSGAAESATSTSDATAAGAASSAEPAGTEPRRMGLIANTGGIGVSHRNDCADGARLPGFGWAERDPVEVLGEGAGRCAGWLLVRADGVSSWVRDGYVAGFTGSAGASALQTARVIGSTGGTGVSHRNDCTTAARLIASRGWADGDTVEVLAGGQGRCSGWLWVRADGVTSWVREQYLLPA